MNNRMPPPFIPTSMPTPPYRCPHECDLHSPNIKGGFEEATFLERDAAKVREHSHPVTDDDLHIQIRNALRYTKGAPANESPDITLEVSAMTTGLAEIEATTGGVSQKWQESSFQIEPHGACYGVFIVDATGKSHEFYKPCVIKVYTHGNAESRGLKRICGLVSEFLTRHGFR